MTTLQEFGCEVCGIVTSDPIHWFVIRCRDSELTCTDGILRSPTRPEPGITAVKPTPRYTSAAGLTQCAHHRSQTSTGPRRRSDVVGAGVLTLTAAKRASPSPPPVAMLRGLRHWQPEPPCRGRRSLHSVRGRRDLNRPADPLPLSRV